MDWSGLINFANILAGAASAVAALFLIKTGYTYVTSSGDPRKQAMAYTSGENIVKGLMFILSATAIANVMVGNLKLG